MKKKEVKLSLIICLVFVLLLSFAGCSLTSPHIKSKSETHSTGAATVTVVVENKTSSTFTVELTAHGTWSTNSFTGKVGSDTQIVTRTINPKETITVTISIYNSHGESSAFTKFKYSVGIKSTKQ